MTLTTFQADTVASIMAEIDRMCAGQIAIPMPGTANYGEWCQFKTDARLETGRGGFWNPEITGVHGNRYRLFGRRPRDGEFAFVDLDPFEELDALARLLRGLRDVRETCLYDGEMDSEPSPVECALDAARRVETAREAMRAVMVERQNAVLAARAAGISWGELAKALSVTRARVQQYSRGE